MTPQTTSARAEAVEITTDPMVAAKPYRPAVTAVLLIGAFVVAAVVLWIFLANGGVPDVTTQGLSSTSVAFSSGILVFREGLEAVLVLAALTAGLIRYKRRFWTPILIGTTAALIATVATWFIAVAVISSISAPELAVQAGTGLLAIVVLLVVMNWFFHKLYWTGWICHHRSRRDRIFKEPSATATSVFAGLVSLGFTVIYREGFEVVLFLQDLRLRAGSPIVLSGAGIGLALTGIVATLTFAVHRRLPYRKMLVYTGVVLAGVLVVMVGESAQEMQLAGWLPTHPLNIPIPGWLGVWFALFPTVEGISAQLLAMVLVLGSYIWVQRRVTTAKPAVVAKAIRETTSLLDGDVGDRHLTTCPGDIRS
ncbi:MAG TPA: FTR1 family protein [Candidatus Krumholzibacteria bacterium]|nr:FTR1 family protein [Candidatus Krumholzibacteria bacterium]